MVLTKQGDSRHANVQNVLIDSTISKVLASGRDGRFS